MPDVSVAPKPASIAASVTQTQAKAVALPKGLEIFDTSQLGQSYFHCCLFGETNSGKTTLAANFAGPEDTRIICTRNKAQLIPLEKQGFKGVFTDNLSAFLFAITWPERLWPDWAGRPNRTLVIDDFTEVTEAAVDDNETNDQGQEIKDSRLVFRGVKSDIRSIFRSTLRANQHVIFTALIRVGKDMVDRKEIIQPEVPPSIFAMLGAEVEYAFYIDVERKKLLTVPEKFVITDPNEIDRVTKQPRVYRREIFAKYKQRQDLPKLLEKYEEADLSKIWQKVCSHSNSK